MINMALLLGYPRNYTSYLHEIFTQDAHQNVFDESEKKKTYRWINSHFPSSAVVAIIIYCGILTVSLAEIS